MREKSETLRCGTFRCDTFHCGNCLRTVDVKPSILRTRLVLSKIIRRQKFTETAEENKVEQAIVRYVLVMLEELEELEELEGLYA